MIPDIFFAEHLSQIQGIFKNLYVYDFLSKYGKDIKINDLSKKLNLPIKTITDGVKFLEKQELIVKKNSGFVIVDLQESTLNKLYKPNLTPSKETIEKNFKK